MRAPERLRAEARALQDEAARLLKDAENIELKRIRREEQDARNRTIERIAREAKSYSDAKCAERLARAISCELSAARMILADKWSQNSRASQARRNRDIVRLARSGLTNGEIAGRYELHAKHVSRIISTATRQGWYYVERYNGEPAP